MADSLDRKSVAYHEAGHAVVAWLCDHELGRCSIKPDNNQGIGGFVVHTSGLNYLFEPGVLVRHPTEPDVYVVRIGEREARPLTEDEAHWLDINHRLGLGDEDVAHIMIASAGQEAQRRFASESVEPYQSQSDWDSVLEDLQRLSKERGKLVEELQTELTVKTAELLTDPLVWQAVSAVADELLRHETIYPKDVTRVVRQKVTGDAPVFIPEPTSQPGS